MRAIEERRIGKTGEHVKYITLVAAVREARPFPFMRATRAQDSERALEVREHVSIGGGRRRELPSPD
jgi:hypothetical protein